MLSSHCRANRPHVGFCLETPCSSPLATGISGLHSSFTWEVRPHLELKHRTPLSSRVVTGTSWSPLSGLKGVKPPVEFRETTRDSSLGPTGEERPQFAMRGNLVGFLELQHDLWGFFRVSTGNSRSPSCGPRAVQSPFKLRGGRWHCSRVTAGESGIKMH